MMHGAMSLKSKSMVTKSRTAWA